AGGRTVLLVSHGTSILAQLCRNVLWMESGRIRMNGPALQIVQAYDLEAHQGADAESWIEAVEDGALAGVIGVPPSEAPTNSGGIPLTLTTATNDVPVGQSDDATVVSKQPAPTTVFMTWPAEVEHRQQTETGKYVFRRGPVFIDAVTLLDHAGRPSTRLTTLRPFALRIAYHCKGELPDETLGVALAINRLADLESVVQWYTQFIRPDETRE